MKTLKFTTPLVEQILYGEKTSTWRLFDDKDLQVGDQLTFINKETGQKFGTAVVESLTVKTLGTLTDEDWIGHEKFASEDEMYETYSRYYEKIVDGNTEVKILSFSFSRMC